MAPAVLFDPATEGLKADMSQSTTSRIMIYFGSHFMHNSYTDRMCQHHESQTLGDTMYESPKIIHCLKQASFVVPNVKMFEDHWFMMLSCLHGFVLKDL